MFSNLDNTIFPDSCEVIEIVPSQLYVFPIFKNGSTSLYESMPDKPWKIISNSDIATIDQPITVYLRDARNRFISGVNTYIKRSKEDNPELDEQTMLWFVDRYLFLNRHYCPQFFWLMNLVRYAGKNVQLKFEHMNNISNLTDVHSGPRIEKPDEKFLEQLKNFDYQQLELYFFLDQLLTDRIGQTLSWQQLNDILKQYPELCKLIFKKAQDLVDVLS